MLLALCHKQKTGRLPGIALLGFVAFSMASGLPGCGRKPEGQAPTASVSGTVSYKGDTLKEGTVMFHPQGVPGAHPATGEIGPNGIYTLTTYNKADGALIGNHIVTIQVFPKGANPGFEHEAPGYVKIPRKYTDVKTSDLLVTVTEGANTINLELKDKK